MASKLNTDHESPLAEINVTPLVDVMLVLLVIFIVLAPLISQGLPVRLPKAGGQSLVEPKVLNVAVLQDGTIQINQQNFALNQIKTQIQSEIKKEPNVVIKIGGDAAVPYENVAQVIAEIQAAGAQKIAFATQK